MKEFFKGITGKTTIISIAAFVFGCCIITYHLSTFQIVDFDPLKPHAILVGLVYFLFLGINIIVFSFLAGSIKDHSFNTLKLTVQGLIKIPFISLIVFFICEPTIFLNRDYKLYFFSYSADIKFISLLIFLMALSLIANTLSVKKDGQEERKYNKRVRNTSIFLAILSVVLLSLTFIKHPVFLSILSLEGFICVVVNIFIVAYRSAKLHNERMEKSKEPITKWSDDTFFDFGKSELGIQLKKLFNILAVIFVTLKVTLNYTTAVYSDLPQLYGGGKLESIAFVVNKDTIKGNKVYETDEFIFLAKKDSTIIKLDWKEINAILKKNQ